MPIILPYQKKRVYELLKEDQRYRANSVDIVDLKFRIDETMHKMARLRGKLEPLRREAEQLDQQQHLNEIRQGLENLKKMKIDEQTRIEKQIEFQVVTG